MVISSTGYRYATEQIHDDEKNDKKINQKIFCSGYRATWNHTRCLVYCTSVLLYEYEILYVVVLDLFLRSYILFAAGRFGKKD